jgi:hypothetical protein
MLFCQLAQAHSLREICGGLRCCLGVTEHPNPASTEHLKSGHFG